MSKKDDENAAAFLVMFLIGAIIAAAMAAYAIGKLILIGIQAYRERKSTKPQLKIKTSALASDSASRKLKTIDDPWLEHCLKIEAAWDRGDYDWARQQLQRIAYGMVNESVTDAQRADFTRLMTAFAKEDPLYREVIDAVRFVVERHPGIVQSKMYQLFPHLDPETIRYVLYFAHELGDITRSKKGRSYELRIPGQIIDSEVVK